MMRFATVLGLGRPRLAAQSAAVVARWATWWALYVFSLAVCTLLGAEPSSSSSSSSSPSVSVSSSTKGMVSPAPSASLYSSPSPPLLFSSSTSSSSTSPAQSHKAKRKQAHQHHEGEDAEAKQKQNKQARKKVSILQQSNKVHEVEEIKQNNKMAAVEVATDNAAPAQVAGSIFLSRVSSLPIVSSAVGQARQLYDFGKSKYPSLTNNIETSVVNRVLPAVINASKPLVTAYDVQLHQIDSLACTGLDALEHRIPLIKQNPNEIIATGKSLLPQLPQVQSVSDMREALRTTLSGAATRSLHQVGTAIDGAITLSETTVDRFLPSERPCAEEVESAGKTTIGRVTSLSTCIGHRLSSRITQQLGSVRLRSPAQLREMAFTVDLIQYAQQSLEHQAAWLKASLVVPTAERVHKAAAGTAEASVKLVGVVLGRLHALTPPTVITKTEAAREALLARVAAIRDEVKDEAHVQRVVAITEDGVKYVRAVGKAMLEYYQSAVKKGVNQNNDYFEAPEGRQQQQEEEDEEEEQVEEEEEDEGEQTQEEEEEDEQQ